MKKVKNIFLLLLFLKCSIFLGQGKSSINALDKAEREVAIIDSTVTLTDMQKGLLLKVLVEKNDFLSSENMSKSRKNWVIEHGYLQKINLILKNNNSISEEARQDISVQQADSTKGLLLDEKLLKKLNLYIKDKNSQ